MPRADVATLLEMLDYGFSKASWHGPNLGGALRGVDSALAQRRLPGRKCIWEQCLHAAYWKQIVLNKLIGKTPFPRAGSNWPKLPADPTKAAWKADVALLGEIHAKLRRAVETINPGRLNQNLRRLIIGAAFHDIYHAGQIRLMRKLLKSGV